MTKGAKSSPARPRSRRRLREVTPGFLVKKTEKATLSVPGLGCAAQGGFCSLDHLRGGGGGGGLTRLELQLAMVGAADNAFRRKFPSG